MKIPLFIFLMSVTAFCLHAAPADKDKLPPIPKEKDGRYGVYSYEDAKKEALKKKQPIAFLVYDMEGKDLELAEKEAVVKAFWAMEKYSTVVIVPSRLVAEIKTRASDVVHAALTSSEAGKTLPRLIVMDQNATAVLGNMSKEKIIDTDEKALKAFSKQMDEANKDPSKAAAPAASPATPEKPAGTTPAPVPAPATAAPGVVVIKDAKPEGWTNTAGKTIQATLLEIAADKVVFLMANGTKIDYPIANLDAASKARLEALKTAR